MRQRRNFTKEFKLSIIRELESGKTPAEIGRQHSIHPTMLSKWHTMHREHGNKAFRGNGNAYTLEAQLAEKDRLIGKLYAENEFLKKVLSVLESRASENRKEARP